MVPHRKILRVIALLATCSTTPYETRNKLCVELAVRFPSDYALFWSEEVLSWLSPTAEVALTTTDFGTTPKYEVAFAAARELGISKYITLGPNGLELKITQTLRRWRKHTQIRMCLETMLLCSMPIAQIVSDMRRMYGLSIDEDSVSEFAALFIDPEFIEGDPWLEYMECIGEAEAQFKWKLMQAPQDYARYKLGVPVRLDNDAVLDRLMSDSYFTAVEMKVEGQTTTAAEVARLKMERDTVFKALDRRMKLEEQRLAAGTGSAATSAAAAIAKIMLDHTVQPLQLASEVLSEQASSTSSAQPAPTDEVLPTLDDLSGL